MSWKKYLTIKKIQSIIKSTGIYILEKAYKSPADIYKKEKLWTRVLIKIFKNISVFTVANLELNLRVFEMPICAKIWFLTASEKYSIILVDFDLEFVSLSLDF